MKNTIHRTLLPAILCAAAAFTTLSGCKQNPPEESRSSAKELTSFKFEKSKNTWLDADIVGKIDKKTVTVTVPAKAYQDPTSKANRKFTAAFTVSNGAKLYFGTKEVKSGALTDLFVFDKEYKVVAADGSVQPYTLRIKIEYDKPAVPAELAEELKKIYGTYKGTLNFETAPYRMRIVCNAESFTSYSIPMSAYYVNMVWEKLSSSKWVCRTYHKNDFARKAPRNTATFTRGADGAFSCMISVHAMNAVSTQMSKSSKDYVFDPDDGNGFNPPKKY